jgi:formate hydrogenlyase subunit 3/multisubunit Na+/H+ antiporter MnhD subunit
MSELLIIIAGFSKGSYAVTSFLMFFLVLAFSGIIYQFSRMLFGRAPKGMPRLDEPVSAKMAYIFLLILIVGLGFTVPWILKDGIAAANEILKGI